MENILSATLLGIMLAFTTGPAFFMLIETSITKGFRAAISFDAGVISADVLFISLSLLTTNSLLQHLQNNPTLFIIAGFILMLYAAFSFHKDRKNRKIDISSTINLGANINYWKLYGKGFLLNAINVGSLAFWLGVIIVTIPKMNNNNWNIFLFFLIILLSYFSLNLLKILLAKKLRTKLTAENIHKSKQIIHIIIFIFGAVLFIQGIFPNTNPSLSSPTPLHSK